MATQKYKLDDTQRTTSKDMIDKIFGSSGTLEDLAQRNPHPQYSAQFEQALHAIGHTPNARQDIVVDGTRTLADSFIDRVFEKTGQLPSEDQVKDFVSSNLTANFAEKYIRGTLNGDSIKTQIVDPYFDSNTELQAPNKDRETQLQDEVAKRTNSALQTKLDELFGVQRKNVTGQIEDQYNKIRGDALNEEAALGGSRFLSPVARLTGNNIDQAKIKATSSALSNLAASQATGQLDVTKSVEGMLAGERRAQEQGDQFRQTLGLKNRMFNAEQDDNIYNRGLTQDAIASAERVGRAKADANKPGVYDYINTGANALNALIKIFGGIYSAAGGMGGGGGGGGAGSWDASGYGGNTTGAFSAA